MAGSRFPYTLKDGSIIWITDEIAEKIASGEIDLDKEPTKEERIEQLIFMNAQRVQRPYYIAQQLKEYEKFDNHRKMIEANDIEELNSNIKNLKE